MKTRETLRLTKSHRAVLDALQQINHATAQQVVDWIKMTGRQSKEVSLTSVYRALNQLVAQHEVKPLHFNDGFVRYELNTHHAHHHHMVCTGCNTIQVLDLCPYEAISKTLQEAFYVQYHNFEVYGLCRTCHV